MGMTIKDPTVHAMARELAARREPDSANQEAEARKAAVLELLQRIKRLPWPDQRSSAELQAELDDDDGLPV